MRTIRFKTKDEWLNFRKGKITGSRLRNIVVKRGTGEKKGFYELIAERVAEQEENFGEDPMIRGIRLEPEAMDKFSKVIGKKINSSLVMWLREDNPDIAISPDGFIGKTVAVEVKCLSSASHIEGFLTKQIPDEYKLQVAQYFVVNDKLKTLYCVFYDPRVKCKEIHYLKIERSGFDIGEIEDYYQYEIDKLKKVDEAVILLKA